MSVEKVIDKDSSCQLILKSKVEYNRKYYEKHKDSLQEKEICKLCGVEYQKYSKSKHEKTKKHIILSEMNALKEKVEELENKN